ncbi:hypothetical protein OAS86_06150 [Gammaproteobacteria bacterium]|nr:hypothetical protein [Gammaproteobacteria bacterium]
MKWPSLGRRRHDNQRQSRLDSLSEVDFVRSYYNEHSNAPPSDQTTRFSAAISLTLVLVAVLIFAVTRLSPAGWIEVSADGQLLASQTLADSGTIKLNVFDDKGELSQYGDRFYVIEERVFHEAPFGTALFAAPVVALANLLGYDMQGEEALVRQTLAALLAVIIFLQLFFLARFWLSDRLSLLLALAAWTGSSMATGLGVGLWPASFATPFILRAIYILYQQHFAGETPRWASISWWLFAALLCMPTTAILIVVMALLLWVYDRPSGLRFSLLALLQVTLLTMLSYGTYKQLFPPSHVPEWSADAFHQHLGGLLVSPVRGLLIYSPWVLVAFFVFWKPLLPNQPKPFAATLLLWPLFHLVWTAGNADWWQGVAYGAIALSGTMPAFYVGLLTACGRVANSSRIVKLLPTFAIASLLLVSIVMSMNGLLNRYARLWFEQPPLTEHQRYLDDWRYPPFRHNSERHGERLARHYANVLDHTSIKPDEVVSYDSRDVVFVGWSTPEPGHRWTMGYHSSILFNIDALPIIGELELIGNARGDQHVTLRLNGHRVGDMTIDGYNHRRLFTFDPDLLRHDRPNTLEFDLPDAESPGTNDPRILAFDLIRLKFR